MDSVKRVDSRLTERGGFLIRRMNQIWSAYLQKCFRDAGYDITSVQFAALDIIVEHPGLDQTDLALRIGCDRATIGGVTARLDRIGYIDRAPSPNDRRARTLFPTDIGRQAAVHLAEIAYDADAALIAPLEEEHRDVLFAVLHKLTATGNALGVAPPFRMNGREKP